LIILPEREKIKKEKRKQNKTGLNKYFTEEETNE
jgi:preprotein translocase subunit Sec61beta